MNYTGNIARRYLFSKKHISLISTLTFISIIGITIGITLLIVILSVFNGFFGVIKGFLLSYDPDLRIESTAGSVFEQNLEVLDKIKSIPQVRVISPYMQGKALLAHRENQNKVVEVKGVDSGHFLALSDIENSLTSGAFQTGVQNSKPGLIVHDQLRSELGLSLNEEIVLLSTAGMRRALTQITAPRNYRFDVRGTYFLQQINENALVYTDLTAAQRLFNARSMISGIDIKLHRNEDSDQVRKKLETLLGGDFKISTWYDLQKPLYDVMYLEKWASYVILMIIIIVAVLNIVGSLTMIVIQKRRDIGILMSMGYDRASIKSIFRKQGLYIGLIGCLFGGTAGLLLSWAQMKFGLVKLSSSFIIDAYPVEIHTQDVLLVLAGSLVLCLLASWYPAARASKIQPADAVRFE